jgi:hypothetical protein
MNAFDKLLTCTGTWEGVTRLQFSAAEPMHESPSLIVVTPLLRGTFIRLDQTWTWEGKEQLGSLLIGHDPKSQTATLHWIDTFHNGLRVMACAGNFNAQGALIVLGSYPAPPGPDWGWRIEIPTIKERRIKIDMFNIDPTGKEDGGVWAEFAPE